MEFGHYGEASQVSSSSFSPDDRENLTGKLGFLCRKDRRIADEDFDAISFLLIELGRPGWSTRPRTYAVLRMMECPNLLDDFIDMGANDNSFPYTAFRMLPRSLQSHERSQMFMHLQKFVLNDACDMLKGEKGKHVSLEDGEILFTKTKGSKLGSGQNSIVDKVIAKLDNRLYARKRTRRDKKNDKTIIKQFTNEIETLKKLHHQHLVKVEGSYTDKKYVAILMTPVADCNFKEYLLRGPRYIDKEKLRSYYGCLAGAIAYLKENKIRHNDIKPENILLKDGHIFLTDFGTVLDWSGTEFKNSVTKNDGRAFTSRYQSPEVAMGGERGSASDVFSLGVVFLEITTLLRDKTLKEMDDHFTHDGILSHVHLDVHQALPAAHTWQKKLTSHSIVSDNAPIAWIQEMLMKEPKNRPTPASLFEEIQQAQQGQFCGNCCKVDDSVSDSSTSVPDTDDEFDVTVTPMTSGDSPESKHASRLRVQSEQDLNLPLRFPGPYSNLNSHKQGESYYEEDPPAPKPRSRLSSWWSNFSRRKENKVYPNERVVSQQSVEVIREDYEEVPERKNEDESKSEPEILRQENAGSEIRVEGEPQIYEGTEDEAQHEQTEQEVLLPGAWLSEFDQYHADEDSPNYEYQLVPYVTKQPQRPSLFNRIFSILQLPTITEVSGIVPSESEIVIQADQDGEGNDEMNEIDRSIEDQRLIPSSRWIEWTNTVEQVTKSDIFSSKMPLRRRSDDNLRSQKDIARQRMELNIQHEVHRSNSLGCLNEDSNATGLPDLPTTKMELKGFSLDNSWTGVIAAVEQQIMFARDVKKTDQLKKYEEAKVVLIIDEASISESNEMVDTISEQPKEKTEEPQEEGIKRVAVEASPIPAINSVNTRIIPEQPKDEIKESKEKDPNSHEKPKIGSPRFSGQNSLKAWLDSQRRIYGATSPPPIFLRTGWPMREEPEPKPIKKAAPIVTAPLTAANLGEMATKVEQENEDGKKLVNAAVYMKRVLADAASSAPTSRISSRTASRLAKAGSMLPWQDRSFGYLEEYTKSGSAATVDYLLRLGCNPGKPDNRRPMPIFNAVRGATQRHSKCVRKLIQFEVDLNIRNSSSGKTPLHYAIEGYEWDGYASLIYMLLQGGADPNIKDKTDQVPLLSILSGGNEPLEKYRRDALALLLAPDYNTDVDVSPGLTKNRPLHLAVRRKDPWAVGIILEKNVQVNQKNFVGQTPLQLATTSWNKDMTDDQLEILDLLIEKGADVNAKDPTSGSTSLHLAAMYEVVRAVKMLLKAGAEADVVDNKGKTPSDLLPCLPYKPGKKTCTKCSRISDLLAQYST